MLTFFGFGLQGIEGKHRLLRQEHFIHEFITIIRHSHKITNPLSKSFGRFKEGMEIVFAHNLSTAVFCNFGMDVSRFKPPHDSFLSLAGFKRINWID